MSWNLFVLVLVDIYVQSSGTSMCILEGQQGGVTHLIYSPDGEVIQRWEEGMSWNVFVLVDIYSQSSGTSICDFVCTARPAKRCDTS